MTVDDLLLGDLMVSDQTAWGGEGVSIEVEGPLYEPSIRLHVPLDADEVRCLIDWLTAWFEENKP